jgi:hypothetical protein
MAPKRNPTLIFRQRPQTAYTFEVHPPHVVDKPSLDEWILGALNRRRSQTVDQLATCLGDVNWSEFFLAIDRLTKSGSVLIWPSPVGDAVLALNLTETDTLEESSAALVGTS